MLRTGACNAECNERGSHEVVESQLLIAVKQHSMWVAHLCQLCATHPHRWCTQQRQGQRTRNQGAGASHHWSRCPHGPCHQPALKGTPGPLPMWHSF